MQLKVDAAFLVSQDCLRPVEAHAAEVLTTSSLEEYLVRLLVADAIRIIIERGIICIDFADVVEILCAGNSEACLGIGIAGGEQCARDAALKAIAAVSRQMELSQNGAFLATVTGSTSITMSDFDAASEVLHQAVAQDASIVFGLLIDDSLAGNIRVSVMAKSNAVPIPAREHLRNSFLLG